MSNQFNVDLNLSTTICPSCGVIFAIPCELMTHRQRNHDTVYCPNGHTFNWPGETDEQRKINSIKSELEILKQDIGEVIEENEKNKSSLKYYKNKASKEKK